MYIRHQLIKLADELYQFPSSAPKPLVVALSLTEAYIEYTLDTGAGLGNTLYWLAVLISIYGLGAPTMSPPKVTSKQAISELIGGILSFYESSSNKPTIKHLILNVLLTFKLSDIDIELALMSNLKARKLPK